MVAGFPPFQAAESSDWWFDKLEKGRIDLFWAAHDRMARFTHVFKDFIVHMIDPDPSKRWSIDELREHDWYKAKIYRDSKMTRKVKKFKAVVERKKREELMALKESAGVESSSFTARGDQETTKIDEYMKGLASDQDFLVDSAKHLKNVHVFTKFDTKSDPLSTAARLQLAVEAAKGQITFDPSHNFHIGRVENKNGQVQFSVQFYKNESASTISDDDEKDKDAPTYTVVFRRMAGNPIDFSKAFVEVTTNKEFIVGIIEPESEPETMSVDDADGGDDSSSS
jgi:serine/threonine protein kinase